MLRSYAQIDDNVLPSLSYPHTCFLAIGRPVRYLARYRITISSFLIERLVLIAFTFPECLSFGIVVYGFTLLPPCSRNLLMDTESHVLANRVWWPVAVARSNIEGVRCSPLPENQLKFLCVGFGMNENNCGPGRIVCSAGNAPYVSGPLPFWRKPVEL